MFLEDPLCSGVALDVADAEINWGVYWSGPCSSSAAFQWSQETNFEVRILLFYSEGWF